MFRPLDVHSQCEIKNLVRADGSMYYYVTPVPFYQSAARSLDGGVVTDKENYFIALRPNPYPPKPQGSKLTKDLLVQLSNGKTYTLKNYDSRYLADTLFEMVFLIDKKSFPDFLANEVESASIYLSKDKPAELFTFRLHKNAVREQLQCLQDLH